MASCEEPKQRIKEDEFSSDCRLFLDSAQFSDFELECEGHVFKVHKIILASRSGWFRRIFEGDWKETSENRVIIRDIQACLFARLLFFLYTGCDDKFLSFSEIQCPQFAQIVDDFENTQGTSDIKAKLAVWMYHLGEYYDIASLQVSAKQVFLEAFKIRHRLVNKPGSVMTEDAVRGHREVINLVYKFTREDDRTLRDIIVRRAKYHIKYKQALALARFLETLRLIPDFAIDIASASLEERSRKCRLCKSSTRNLQYRCKCGKLAECSEEECCQLRTQRSFCFWCCEFGVLTYTPSIDAAASTEPPTKRARID